MTVTESAMVADFYFYPTITSLFTNLFKRHQYFIQSDQSSIKLLSHEIYQ